MKSSHTIGLIAFAGATAFAVTKTTPPAAEHIRGDYLEVRSCDVYTGPCFANAEMGLTGKEGILTWSVRQGAWEGTDLSGLNVIAVVHANATLGDQQNFPRRGKAVLIVDAKANAAQQHALADFARSMGGSLISEVVSVKSLPIQSEIGTCNMAGRAAVKAGGLVEIATRCFGEKDHVCGNEETYYPPLTEVSSAAPAFAELAAYRGEGLDVRWEGVGQRSAFTGTFAR